MYLIEVTGLKYTCFTVIMVILSVHCGYKTYLYNVFRVLCSILENVAAVLQVLLIQPQCLGINLLQRCVPKFRLLQVDQEVGVDWTALNETQTVGCSIETRERFVSHLPLGFTLPSSL